MDDMQGGDPAKFGDAVAQVIALRCHPRRLTANASPVNVRICQADPDVLFDVAGLGGLRPSCCGLFPGCQGRLRVDPATGGTLVGVDVPRPRASLVHIASL